MTTSLTTTSPATDLISSSGDITPTSSGTLNLRPEVLERAVNRGTANALRCLEIASGAPFTAAELAATKPSEINRECPSIANPNYKPAPGQ